VSDAQVAETRFTAFASRRNKAITARLIVSRVKDLNRKGGEGQGELFTIWRHHVVSPTPRSPSSRPRSSTATTPLSGRASPTWPTGPWHTCRRAPSASAAWLACAATSHNLLRAAGSPASLAYAKARGASIRRDLIDVAARTARHGRGCITIHLPEDWHRQHEWANPFENTRGPPTQAA
jgi:hypothetical protein